MSKKVNILDIAIQLPKYKDNTVIKKYAEGDASLQDNLNLIKSIIKREGGKNYNLFSEELVLDLDEVERKKRLNQMEKTVDFVVGCINNVLLMAEAKFNVHDADNLSATDLKQKIKHSRQILNKGGYKVFKSTVLLFNDDKFEQNKLKTYRLFNYKKDVMIPLTVKDFHEKVFH